MNYLRHLLLTLALLPSLVSLGRAQSNTQIADTVRNVDGSLFNGTVVITWTGNSVSNGVNAVPYSTSVKIYNGVLSVFVVPNVSYGAPYVATYNSSDGKTSWIENWMVGPSSSALTLAQVRSTLSTNPTGPGAATLSMGQVTGLSAYLNALSASLGTVSSSIGGFSSNIAGITNSVSSLTDRVNTLQASISAPTASNMVQGETPGGTINGTNATFTIATTPVSASSVMIFRNGVLQTAGTDYSFSGTTITFATSSIPQSGDSLQASYRIGTSAQSASFVDNETPQGAINGSNLTFLLAHSPTAGTLLLYKNGELMLSGADYSLTGATITFVSSSATPLAGDSLVAYYRIPTN